MAEKNAPKTENKETKDNDGKRKAAESNPKKENVVSFQFSLRPLLTLSW
jgi:hypothetical protein